MEGCPRDLTDGNVQARLSVSEMVEMTRGGRLRSKAGAKVKV